MKKLTIIFTLLLALSGTQSVLADIKCDCYNMGYRDGAMSNVYGGPTSIPSQCRTREAQVPGRSDYSYSLGYGYGKNIEGAAFASTRSKNAKWAQDRTNEHNRYKRLMCF